MPPDAGARRREAARRSSSPREAGRRRPGPPARPPARIPSTDRWRATPRRWSRRKPPTPPARATGGRRSPRGRAAGPTGSDAGLLAGGPLPLLVQRSQTARGVLVCRRKLRDPCRVVICLMVSQQLLDAAYLRFELLDAVFHCIDGGAGFRARPGCWERTTGLAGLRRDQRSDCPLPAPIEVAVIAEVHGHRAVFNGPEPRRDRI